MLCGSAFRIIHQTRPGAGPPKGHPRKLTPKHRLEPLGSVFPTNVKNWIRVTLARRKSRNFSSNTATCQLAGVSEQQSMAREYQLVIYGATGFTGGLATKYVSKQYLNSGLRWAIAGRSKEKLNKLAEQCTDNVPGIIVADSGDASSLHKMASSTEVVVTTAGPFARYGSPLVAACVKTGTDYCDITGEIDWVRGMIAEHDDAARSSGSHIVHLCGHDSVPWDLMTLMLAKKLKEGDPEEELKRIDMYDDIKSMPSGGTLETAFGIMFGAEKNLKKSSASTALGFDPLVKPFEGTQPSPNSVSVRNVNMLQMGKGADPHRTMFVMAGVNGNTVKRSNALNGYGPKVTYCEGQAFKSLWKAIMNQLGFITFGVSLVIPPIRWFLRKFVLPKPGEGPSEEFMSTGYLTVTGVAKGTKGGEARGKMHFSVDPGYKDTARMVVEAGLSFVYNRDQITRPGGVYTPASCQGEVLLKRLISTGTTFESANKEK